ncbi:MAG: hypothetical protein K6G12_03145 [Lachnospiraceae bacterium]|nr:hypothetical protein [Lachnospiraceae bacterium]
MNDTTENNFTKDPATQRAEFLKLMSENCETIIKSREAVKQIRELFAEGTTCSITVYQVNQVIEHCDVSILPDTVPGLMDLIETDIQNREALVKDLGRQISEVL